MTYVFVFTHLHDAYVSIQMSMFVLIHYGQHIKQNNFGMYFIYVNILSAWMSEPCTFLAPGEVRKESLELELQELVRYVR